MYDFVEVHPNYIIERKTYERKDPCLGRKVKHDSRSKQYAIQAKDPAQLKSIRHQRNIPTLDQGQIGSCTGNAGTGALGSGVFWEEGATVLNATDVAVDETFAVALYSDGTKIDSYDGSYPPEDTGCDGLSIAQVLKARGMISGYIHAFTLEAALTALSEAPCIVGVEWHADSFNPDPDGRIHITGEVRGGHEIVFDELDVENKRVWFTNSWGEAWGVNGRAYLTWDDFGTLLSHQGDLTQFVPITQPAPTPTPVPPTPPSPAPVPDPSVFAELIDEVKAVIASLEKLLGSIVK